MWMDGQNGRMDGQRQNYIPRTSPGDQSNMSPNPSRGGGGDINLTLKEKAPFCLIFK